jgi:filamentous hemagglutinin family protein
MIDAARLASLAFAVLLPVALEAQVDTLLLREGDSDPLLPTGREWEIGEEHGSRPGGPGGVNLLHSFERFDLGGGDTARFTADNSLTTRSVIVRVVGGQEPSQIHGTLASDIEGADLYLLNARGVVFGRGAKLDLSGSFFASSASWLRLYDDAESFEAFSNETPILAASPREFGFLDSPGPIEVKGSQLAVGAGESIGLVGGSVRIVGGAGEDTLGFLDTSGGRIDLASLRGRGSVLRTESPSQGLSVDGPRGDISLELGAIVNSSGIPPGIFCIGCLEGEVDRGAGDIFVRAHHLTLEDAEIRAMTPSLESAGDVDIDLTGDLTIRQTAEFSAGIFAGSGLERVVAPPGDASETTTFPFPGQRPPNQPITTIVFAPRSNPVAISYRTQGPSGDVIVHAENMSLEGGSRISTTSFFGGEPGSIVIDVENEVNISATDGNASALFSNGQGGSDAGAIDIDAAVLRMAGGIVVTEARNDPGKSSGRGGDIVIDVARLELTDNARIDSSTRGSGDGGNVTITASESISLSGGDEEAPGQERAFSGISAIAQDIADDAMPGQIGRGGSIEVVTPVLRMTDRSEISARADETSLGGGSVDLVTASAELSDGARVETSTAGAGPGGTIRLDVERLQMQSGARIAATSRSALPEAGDAGSIEIGLEAGRHRTTQVWLTESGIEAEAGPVNGGEIALRVGRLVQLDLGSQISASVGGGNGGNVVIGEPETVAVLGGSQVLAQATEQRGSGGRVEVTADLIVAEPGSFSASAPGGPALQGEVEIKSPVVNLEGQVAAIPVQFLDASSMLLAQCSARRSGQRSGSFQVARWPGLPVSPAGPLLALDPTVAPNGLSPDPPGLPAVATGADEADEAGARARSALLESARMLRGGNAQAAAAGFSRVAAASQGNVRADALRGEGQAQQLQGAYAESIAPLEQALAAARAADDRARQAAALSQLGNAYIALREPERALPYLRESVAMARRAGRPGLLATTLNNLGNYYAIQGEWDQAQTRYAESATAAGDRGDALRAAEALANAGRVDLERGTLEDSAALLIRARLLTRHLDGGAEALALRIHLADSYARLAARAPSFRREGLHLAHRTLLEASSEAGASDNPRLQAYAYGRLGALYAQEGGRDEEALYLTQRSLALAEQVQAAELLARGHAQAGQIQVAQGDPQAAVASYTRAVEILEQTRPEARAHYGSAEASFQESVAPVYLALVDLLLKEAATLEGAAAQEKLRFARATVERFKAAELRDYFQDECVAALEAQTQSAEELSATAAVVYPIVLPDRLEILVSRPAGIARHTVPVSANTIGEVVERFRRRLQESNKNLYLRPARALHDWLLAPYADALSAEGIDTLVVVPDALLRTIPWAALHDGERFAIERFAMAVTPSLDLIAPKPLDSASTRMLLAGVSQAVQGEAALPNVPGELEAIQALYGGELLLDGQFREARLREELRERPPGVVHIASHARFTGDPRTSYVLTHDEKLNMNELSQLVATNRFGAEPLELLILSACETAAGDARAALGLAGVAVRAGARSAVGSLWSVSDQASSELIVRFYEELGRQDATKAQAMARAQRALLATGPYDHPFYWAGFLVINNWL